jgi:hypothetical protein
VVALRLAVNVFGLGEVAEHKSLIEKLGFEIFDVNKLAD